MAMRRVGALAVAVACSAAVWMFPVGAGASTGSAMPRLLNWDPKLAPIAGEVEAIRGLKFEHAVPVHYLGDQAFEKRLLRKDDPTPSKTQTAAFQRSENMLRALGLLDHDVDLHALDRKAVGSDTLAFYDPFVRQIFVRGTDTTSPATRVTLAHELTHALQDQHFNLLKLQLRAFERGNSTVVKAVIEGDATYVQNQFANKLSDAGQKAYQESQLADTAQARALDVPEIIKVELSAPYALGEGLVATVREAKGRRGEDALFTNPPTSELALVDPSSVVAKVNPVTVATPKLAAGEQPDGKATDLGAFGLFAVLSSRQPASDAIAAADLWRGDRLVQFRRDGRSCVRADVVGQDPTATDQIRAALAQWSGASGVPGATATAVSLRGNRKAAELTSCAPTGASKPIAPGALLAATELLAGRNTLATQLSGVLGSSSRARCVASKLVAIPEFQDAVAQTEAGTLSLDDGKTRIQQIVVDHRAAILASCA
jgi:hypothetical protein